MERKDRMKKERKKNPALIKFHQICEEKKAGAEQMWMVKTKQKWIQFCV